MKSDFRKSGSSSEDAALARALLQSEKDLREHRLVLESIARRVAEGTVGGG